MSRAGQRNTPTQDAAKSFHPTLAVWRTICPEVWEYSPLYILIDQSERGFDYFEIEEQMRISNPLDNMSLGR
jgi:hypothetical protein